MRLLLAALLTASPQPLCTLPASITESSGIASSSVSDDWFFTHEDSGSAAQFEAVGTDGRLLATYRLGVQARDWEDMARGPDDAGRSSLFLADIGDNSASRDRGLLVHRVPEPDVDPRRTGRVVDEPAPVSFRLVYEDGPHDAEALIVDPRTGRMYVVTKGIVGRPRVYAAPEHPSATSPNQLVHVADVDPDRTGTAGGPGIGRLANVLVTAADVSPDGGRVAVRTYTDLYEWRVRDGDLAGAFDHDPVVTALPPTYQGEGLAYTRDGTALLTTTEGKGAPVFRVPSALAEVAPPDTAEDRRPVLIGVAAAVLVGAAVVLRLRSRRRTRGR